MLIYLTFFFSLFPVRAHTHTHTHTHPHTHPRTHAHTLPFCLSGLASHSFSLLFAAPFSFSVSSLTCSRSFQPPLSNLPITLPITLSLRTFFMNSRNSDITFKCTISQRKVTLYNDYHSVESYVAATEYRNRAH